MASIVTTSRAHVPPELLPLWDRVVGKDGVPQVFDGTHQWMPEPSAYLWQKSSEPRFSSPNSWRAAAVHLKEVLSFFEERGWDWRMCGRAHFGAYHDAVRKPGHGRTPLSRNTWNQRVGHWIRFLRWAEDEGHIPETPIKQRDTARWGGGRSQGADLAEPGNAETTRCLPASHYREFARYIPDRRDRLMADVMVSTGLRVSEALALEVGSLPDPSRAENRDKPYLPQVVMGKGRRTRTIEWPATLLARVRRHCREERADVVEALLRQGRQADEQALWLTARGRRPSAGHVQRVFRMASVASSIHATPHVLRHTYATQLLGSLLKAEAAGLEEVRARGGTPAAGDMVMNPLRFVQRRMGHARIATTFIYLHLIEDVDPAVLLAQDEFVRGYVV